jgi:hypothetical protein
MRGRRRRHGSSIGPAVVLLTLVLGVVAAIVIVVLSTADDGAQPPPVAAPAEPSPPTQQLSWHTIVLDPRTGYTATVRTSDVGRQTLTTQNLAFGDGDKRRYGGEVTVYEGGGFDPARLRDATPLTVRDHPASLVTDFTFPESTSGDGRPYRTEAIGWQDVSGVWLLVYAAPGTKVSRAELLRFADTVTVGERADLRAPFRLGPLPAGLTPTYLRSAAVETGRSLATVGLSAANRRPSDAAVYDAPPPGTAVSITAAVPGPDDPRKPADFTVAGHDAWYTTGANALNAEGAGGKLTVAAAGCTLTVEAANREHTPRAALQRIVEGLTIGDCDQPDTWISPLS